MDDRRAVLDDIDELPGMLTVAQIAIYLQVTPQTISQLIRRGDLPAFRPPGMRGYRVYRAAFKAYVEAGFDAVEAEVERERVDTDPDSATVG